MLSDFKLQYLTYSALHVNIEHHVSTVYLHEIGKHQDGHCNKPETSHSPTCLAVLAACKRLNLTPIIDIIFSDGRLLQQNRIISSLDRKLNFKVFIIGIFGGCN